MAFRIALSGINAASADLNITAHNIANASTTGFKQSRGHFADVYALAAQGLSAIATGSGVRLADVQQGFSQGNVEFTDNNLDLAISGQGFFTLSDNGARVYSRAGAFSPDRNGYVVNPQGQRLQIFPPLASGGFDTGSLRDLQLSVTDSAPQPTSRIGVGLNLPANASPPTSAVFDPADPLSYTQTTSLSVYDSLGASHQANIYFVRGAAQNTWDAHVTVDGAAAGPPIALTYSSAGELVTPAGGRINLPGLPVGTGAADLDMSVDFSLTTQYGDTYGINELTQDGYTTGRLTGIEITQEGAVRARYTNGQATSLGQVALARFANEGGLQQLGDTAWGETYVSGQALVGAAGSASFGLVQSGALEASNVDLTEQLVNMITAQRNFQANSQVISTSDQMTQTILNIR